MRNTDGGDPKEESKKLASRELKRRNVWPPSRFGANGDTHMRKIMFAIALALVAAIAATLFLLPEGQDQSQEQPSPHAIDQSD